MIRLYSSTALMIASRRTHADDAEDVTVDVERALVDSARECWGEALSESLGDDELPRYFSEARVQLQSLCKAEKRQQTGLG